MSITPHIRQRCEFTGETYQQALRSIRSFNVGYQISEPPLNRALAGWMDRLLAYRGTIKPGVISSERNLISIAIWPGDRSDRLDELAATMVSAPNDPDPGQALLWGFRVHRARTQHFALDLRSPLRDRGLLDLGPVRVRLRGHAGLLNAILEASRWQPKGPLSHEFDDVDCMRRWYESVAPYGRTALRLHQRRAAFGQCFDTWSSCDKLRLDVSRGQGTNHDLMARLTDPTWGSLRIEDNRLIDPATSVRITLSIQP